MSNLAFTPPQGLNGDDTVFNAPGAWRNSSLMRFWQGSWESKGGWERLMLDNLGGVCRSVVGWTTFGDLQTIGFGLHNGLKVWQGSLLYDITPTTGFTAGQTDGTGGAGYGTGAYGIGTFGTPSLTDYFPLTWALAPWGGNLIACPRGQSIFEWDANTAHPAALIAGAPAKVTHMVVVPQRQVMALGCNEETSGTFNPLCIRWSDIENETVWTSLPSNNAGEWVLETGGRIVCGRVIGNYVLVWTTDSLFLGSFIGDVGQTWKFERVGGNCGAISAGAPVVRGQNVMWIGPDLSFWSYSLGGTTQLVPCPISSMFQDFMALGQNDKIVGSTVAQFGEMTWFYPDTRDGLECSRALTVGPEGWSRDFLARSAYCDTGPQAFPIGVSPTGSAYWHEKGNSNDGAPLVGFIESAAFYLGESDAGVMVNGLWPDFKSQQGIVKLTLYGRQYPQGAERAFGPWSLQPSQLRRSFRMSTRIARVRFDFNSAPAFVRGGRPEFDISSIGGR
jgi:hypothetical protein